MSRVAMSLLTVLGVGVTLFAVLGWWSARAAPAASGVRDGRLAPCDAAPHCVCSEGDGSDASHWVAPISLPDVDGETRWRVIREMVAASGGRVQREDQHYLHATYTSRLFRFVDDVELRMDGARLQVRSSSRVGYSDLGANAARVADLRARLMVAFAGLKS
ncbi:MAG: DUF1499 domain-containing protein [Proteobacteria bacterium]|nr:DUF1499 domain-containing protein [Pseudomonadota bacterium]